MCEGFMCDVQWYLHVGAYCKYHCMSHINPLHIAIHSTGIISLLAHSLTEWNDTTRAQNIYQPLARRPHSQHRIAPTQSYTKGKKSRLASPSIEKDGTHDMQSQPAPHLGSVPLYHYKTDPESSQRDPL